MTKLSRRHTLSLMGASMLSPMLVRSPALAVEPVTVAIAAAALVSTVLDMMKQSGATEALLKAIDLKLDAILANQVLMMQVMAIMDQKLNDIQQAVMGIPAETVGLQTQIAAADATKNVIRSAQNNNKPEYKRFRTKLIDVASTIESTSRAATPPSLVCAGWHAIDGINFVARRDFKKLPVKDETVLGAVSDLRKSFTALQSSESMLSKRLVDTQNRITAVETQIASNAVFQVLPATYVDASRAEPSIEASEIGAPTLCVRRTEAEKIISSEAVRDFVTETKMRTVGFASWVRESVSHRRIAIKVMSQVAFGGRQIITLRVAPSEAWARGTWTREVFRGTNGITHKHPIRNVADATQLDGCLNTPLDKSEYPTALAELQTMLDTRNALVAVESGLLGLKTLCGHGLKRCDEIDGSKA